MRRRDFLKGVAGAGVALASMTGEASAAWRRGRRVAVLGGGCAGMSAAHELAERDFEVTVYEKRAVPGGKCRSIPVPGTGVGGRRDLPGEHGFRFFPGYYRHVIDTMERIPFGTNRRGVRDNLVSGSRVLFAREGGANIEAPFQKIGMAILNPDALRVTIESLLRTIPDLDPVEIANFAIRVLEYATSSQARRDGQYDKVSWYDFTRASRYSSFYQNFLVKSLTRNLVAAQAELASTRTIGSQGMQILIMNILLGQGGDASRLLNQPTSDAWLDPWQAHLEDMGVTWYANAPVQQLHVANREISGATVVIDGVPRTIDADWYVLAVPAEVARTLATAPVRAAAPELAGLDHLIVEWMTGIQYFLGRPFPIVNGHVTYVDSPWALTSVSQGQFWNVNLGGFGDGRVRDIVSVDVSNWDEPGVLFGKPAKECTKEQIFQETWEQMRRGLAGEYDLNPAMVIEEFLDPGIVFGPGGTPIHNEEPLLVNTVDSWRRRPDAVTSIPNLFLASDYVKTHTDLATMEGANEAARRAVNGILNASGSLMPRCGVWPLEEPAILAGARAQDALRYALRLPHILSYL
jgi:uncharacterized protein with NAD-binding domain and iron-sulfur cluster